MRSFRRFIPVVAAMLLISIGAVSCKPASTPASPTAIPTVLIPSATSEPVVQAATPTAEAVQPTEGESNVPVEIRYKGPFQRFNETMGVPPGKLTDLWADSLGNAWIAAESGVYSGTQGFWQLMSDQNAGRILGEDAKNRVWVLFDDGERIGYTDSFRWRIFDAASGWTDFDPSSEPGVGFGDNLATDQDGHVWLATGRGELRRFEPGTETWKSITAEEMGFPLPSMHDYQGNMVTDAAVSKAGILWVSACLGEGEVFSAAGVRRLDTPAWNIAPPTEKECVLDMETTTSGEIWVAGINKVLRYDPLTGGWDDYSLPAGARALVTQIDLDQEGMPWIEVARAGGASQFGASQRYHLKAGAWVLDYDPGRWIESSLAFDASGQAWICAAGQVVLVGEAGVPLDFGQLDAAACTIAFDNSDRGWLLAEGGVDEGLWTFEP